MTDNDWDFIENDYSSQYHSYKFASSETPIQLRNDTGGMDEEDEGVDVICPYQQNFMGKAGSTSEEEMSDVPECEMSSREGSVMDDEVSEGMHPVDSSFGSFSNGPVVFRQEGGDEVMAMEMEMQMEGISTDSSKKRKRWDDDDNLQQQPTQQFNYPPATGFAVAPWGSFEQNSVKRVRVQS